MPSPFPGMDPYVEDPAIWPDCHDALIIFIRGALQPLLRPRYAAVARDRQVLISPERPRYPDVSVVRTGGRPASAGTRTKALVADTPVVFEESEDREPYLEIIEAATNRLVTAIEVLSPDNKRPGDGRRSYLRKRRELLSRRANFVEIDLLRAGRAVVRLSAGQRRNLRPWRYLVVVSRRSPRQMEAYAVPLANRLPRIAVPLDEDVPSVTLDLQAAFTRAWDEGAYPELLRYDQSPPGRLTPEELAWCEEILRNAGHRQAR
jgi:hypothetical protein